MINTVLGKINKYNLGITLIHEHIFVGSAFIQKALGKRWLNENKLISLATDKLLEAKEKCNLSTIVDGTPIDYGRNLDIIREVSLKSGVNIIYSTGLYYDEYAILKQKSIQEISDIFAMECLEGSEDTYNKEQKLCPGMLKCATGISGVTELNKKYLSSIGAVQEKTGLPLFVHAEHSIKSPYEQLSILKNAGVDFDKTIIGHCSDSVDVDYIANIAKSGCFIGFDRVNCTESQISTFTKLLESGFGNKLLLSCDSCINSDFSSLEIGRRMDSNPYVKLLDDFCSKLKEQGVNEKLIHNILIDNPQKLW